MKKMRICTSSMTTIWRYSPIKTLSSTKITSSCREITQLKRTLIKKNKRPALRRKANPNNRNKNQFKNQNSAISAFKEWKWTSRRRDDLKQRDNANDILLIIGNRNSG